MSQNRNIVYHNIKTATPLNTNAGGFTGQVNFSHTVPSNKGTLDLQNSYFTIRGTFTAPLVITGADDEPATNMGFCNNPAGVLFNSIDYSLNDRMIQKINQYGIHSTCNKLLNSCERLELSSGSPFLTYENKIVIGAWKEVNQNIKIRNSSLINYIDTPAANTFYTYDTAANASNKWHFVISFPFPFLERDLSPNNIMYGNTKHDLNFQISSTLMNDIFINKANSTGHTLEVNTFEWCIPMFDCPIPKNISTVVEYQESFTHRTNHISSSYSVSVPSNSNLACVYFTRRTGLGPVLLDTLTPIGLADSGPITYVNVSFNGVKYPHNEYNINPANANIVRAYEDYKRFTNAFALNEEPLIKNIKQFYEHIFFVFRIDNAINLTHSVTNLLIEVGGVIGANLDINLITYYNKKLTIDYGNEGELLNTDLIVAA